MILIYVIIILIGNKFRNSQKRGDVRIKIIWKKAITVVSVLAMLFIFGVTEPLQKANAQSLELLKPSGEEMLTVIKDVGEIQKTKNIAIKALENGKVITYADSAELNYDKANVGEITSKNETYTVLSIPIVADKYNPISNLAFVMLKGEIVTYSETLITKSPQNTVAIASYTDGKLVNENITDIEYLSNSEVQASLDRLQNLAAIEKDRVETKGIEDVALCLSAVLLIDLVVARIVAATCIAACSTLAAPVCAVCITGVFALGGLNIGAVTGCFGKI